MGGSVPGSTLSQSSTEKQGSKGEALGNQEPGYFGEDRQVRARDVDEMPCGIQQCDDGRTGQLELEATGNCREGSWVVHWLGYMPPTARRLPVMKGGFEDPVTSTRKKKAETGWSQEIQGATEVNSPASNPPLGLIALSMPKQD